MPVDAPPALAWSYSTSANRYRAPDGRFIGAEQVRNLRNEFLDARTATARSLAADLASDKLSLPEWEQSMRDEVKVVVGTEFAFGKGGIDQMTAQDWSAAGDLVAAQYPYLNDFAGDIAAGTMSEDAIGARSELYVAEGIGAYERGAASASGVDLPVYPGDDCDGGNRCRCSWEIDPQDDGSVDATWIAEPDACEVCADHADEYSPLTIDPGE